MGAAANHRLEFQWLSTLLTISPGQLTSSVKSIIFRDTVMTFLHSALMLGISSAIVAGIMCGAYTVPMKYLGRWSWENVWAIFIFVSCVLMPVMMVAITAPKALEIVQAVPAHVVVLACAAGFGWGFGAIMFGQCVSAIGVSMANTLVLAISATLGSLLPMALLAPEKMAQCQGRAVLCGSLVGLAGIACCGYAGLLKEKHQAHDKQGLRGNMVGKARPVAVGIMLSAGAGLLSAVLNIGYSFAQPILAAAVHSGCSPFGGTNIIMLLLLGSGSIPSLCFCAYLLAKNASWKKFAVKNSGHLYSLAILMGLLWGGEMFLYGYATPKIGKIGPAIGWPLKLITGLITANAIGYLTGEWKLTRPKARIWMLSGVVVLLLAIVLLGWSSTVG
jgi:L-rhamnose-H+ transport protein